MWVANRRVELDGINLYDGYIDLKIQWYDQIPRIYGSDLFYIFHCDNNPHVQSHTHIFHGKISMAQTYVTAERHTYARNKITFPSELLHGNDLHCKLNGRK